MLSDNQVKHRCLLYGGAAQCRYLQHDNKNYGQFNCVRQMAGTKRDIDKKVNKHIADCKKAGVDPNNHYMAIGTGTGCAGYPHLPNVKQGYDIKP